MSASEEEGRSDEVTWRLRLDLAVTNRAARPRWWVAVAFILILGYLKWQGVG
jgi:hypothetical protein